MKTGKAIRKVPDGKMLQIEVKYGKRIEVFKLTGDFFLHPEEALDTITQALTGLALPLDVDLARSRVANALESWEAQLIGADAEDIISTLQEALQ